LCPRPPRRVKHEAPPQTAGAAINSLADLRSD
jgi:hypothetical protein